MAEDNQAADKSPSKHEKEVQGGFPMSGERTAPPGNEPPSASSATVDQHARDLAETEFRDEEQAYQVLPASQPQEGKEKDASSSSQS